MIDVSVITATYDALKRPGLDMLKRSIASVSALPFAHEHIVQDGASKDGTAEAIAELAEKDVHIKLSTCPDLGIYDALNKGIKRSKGHWIYVLGCDDEIVQPDEMKQAVEIGEKNGAEIVVSPVYVSSDCSTTSSALNRSFFCGMPYSHQGMLMRSELIRELGGFNLEYPIAADYEMTARALLRGVRVVSYNHPYTLYGTDGLSSTSSKIIDDYAAVRKKLFGMNKGEAEDLIKRRILPWRIVFKHLFRSEDYFRRAIRFHIVRNLADNLGMIDDKGVCRLGKGGFV